jgi:rhodanese-related sulfurtransferase
MARGPLCFRTSGDSLESMTDEKPHSPKSRPGLVALGGDRTLRVIREALVVLCLSCLLGLAFNSANPIGIRWSEPSAAKVVENPASPVLAHSTPPTPVQPATAKASLSPAPSTAAIVPPAAQLPTIPPPPQYVPPTPAHWLEVKPLHLKGELVLLDARSKAAYDAGHIPGSISLPEPASHEEIAAFRQRYPTNTHLVAYCSSTSCSLSFKLAHRLAREGGYGFVQYMTGGYFEWLREESLATASSTKAPAAAIAANGTATPAVPANQVAPVLPQVMPTPSDVKSDFALPITLAQARPLLKLQQLILLDARDLEDYRAGHVSGALSLPADSRDEAIRALLGNHARKARLVAYCGSMGCEQGFQLASRLIRDFDFVNAQFLLEGYAEWQLAEKSTPHGEASR